MSNRHEEPDGQKYGRCSPWYATHGRENAFRAAHVSTRNAGFSMTDSTTSPARTAKGPSPLREVLNKFLILHGVRGVMVIRENGSIVVTIKSGMEYDNAFMTAVSTLMVGSKATADNFYNAPAFMVFMEFLDYFLLLAPLRDEFYVLVIAENTANIGQINQAMKKNKEDLVAFL
jgi:predicted regulator of Ras-like GTPase activity (Roadblock/LC7/MglB family)